MADGYVSQVQLPNNETYDIKDKNAVKDITSSDISGNINFTKGEETKDILVKDFGTAYGIDCYKGKFPLDFTSPGGAIDEWKIYGNSSGPTEVLETQSVLPTTITAHSGNAVDWEIYGNNNPVVENTTGDLPIEVSATAGNAIDWTIYGNDDNGTENLLPFADKEFTVTWGASSRIDVKCENGNLYFSGLVYEVFSTNSAWRDNLSFTLEAGTYSMNQYSTAPRYIRQKSDNTVLLDATQTTFTLSSATEVYLCFYLYKKTYDNTKVEIALVKGSTAPDHYIPYQKGVGERTVNLFDCTTVSWGTNEGQSTQKIPVTVGAKYYVTRTSELYALARYYKSDDTSSASSGWLSASGKITIPADTVYVRMFFRNSSYGTLTEAEKATVGEAMFTAGSTAPSTYVPYGYEIPISVSHNMLGKVKQGTYETDGFTTQFASSMTTEPVYLEAGTYIYHTPDIAFSLTTRKLIVDGKMSSGTVFTGANRNVDISFKVSTAGLYTFQVNLNSSVTQQNLDTFDSTAKLTQPTNYTFYIGNSPLTQGQSITKAQSGQDITLFSGDNIIDTTLVNKPQVDLTYQSSVLGVGERTGNEFNVDIVQGYYNTTNGIFIPNSTRYVASGKVSIIGGQKYTLSFDCDKQASSAASADGFIYFWNNDMYINGTQFTNKELCTFTAPSDANTFAFIVGAGSGGELIPSDVTNIMLVKGLTAPTTYVPYGYQIPLLVTSGQQSTPHTIYIGSAPLTEGQSVTKASSGTDIALYQGENTISTTLGNKPEMKIDYLSTVVGVGERTGNLYNKNATDVNNGYVNPGRLSHNGNVSTTPIANSDVSVSEYIDIEELIEYTICDHYSTANYGGCFYDKDKVYISGFTYNNVNHGTTTITSPINAKYLRLSVASYIGENQYKMMLVKGSAAPTTYIPHGYQIPIDIKQDDEVVDHKDIYIGTQPLVEGDYINQTGVYRRLHQFVNYASSSSLPNYNFIPITEQLIAGNGENTITTSLVNNTTIDVELHPTKQASWICDRLEDLQRRIDNVDSTLGAPERRNYLVTWCSEDRLTGSTANLDFSFNNKDSGYSTFLIDGKSTATSAFTETINLLHMINGTVQYSGSNNYTVARPGKYVIVIFGVEMEDSSSNTITLKIIRDNVVIASQQLVNEYIGCIPFEIPNDLYGNNTIIQIEVNSTTGWTDLSFGAGIAVLNATMLLQDSNLKTDTMAIGNFSMYDSYVQLLRSHRSLESKCTILENKCTVLENEYDQLANESVKDIIVYSDYTSTIPSGLSIDISQYKNKIKYVDIYFTDNNYRKGEVYPYNILAENFGYLRIPYGQIYTGASADEATRLSLSLIGDENSYYIRRELFYVSTDYEQEHLFFSQYSSVPGLILQFVGTPTNEWSDFSVKGKASEVIKIYEVHLIVSP